MRVHVLQHVPFEGLGSIQRWLDRKQWPVGYTRFHLNEALPAPDKVDLVIALGGPMSVNDQRELPWLREEMRFIADVVRSGKALLGICLGSQLIASALGARVFAGPEKEIGWHPIRAEKAEGDIFTFPPQMTVFQWHGETFELPPGAKLLASGAMCRNQAFQIGRRVIGIQFHLETTPESADAIINHCRHELQPGRFVQSEAQLRAAASSDYAEINRYMATLLDYIAGEWNYSANINCRSHVSTGAPIRGRSASRKPIGRP